MPDGLVRDATFPPFSSCIMRNSHKVRAAIAGGFALLASACSESPTASEAEDVELTSIYAHAKKPASQVTKVSVGEKVYHDANLSRNKNQSCASCHAAEWGFFGPDDGSIETIGTAFFEGSLDGEYGDRKPPSAAYAAYAAPLNWDLQEGTFRGGNFWDGRATGGKGLTAATMQAIGPFAAGPEHAFSPICVLYEISVSSYKAEFERATGVRFASIPFSKVAGGMGFCHDPNPAVDPTSSTYLSRFTKTELAYMETAYTSVGDVIGAFEFSPRVNRFNSRFDTRALSADELAGEALFFGASGCDKCHSTDVGPQIFTDFSYYNIGVPRNPLNPKGKDWKDPGLGAFLAAGFDPVRAPQFMGFFKSPGLRNVDARQLGRGRTYMHNGVFTSLAQVVHFYNTRDVKSCTVLGLPDLGILPTGPDDTTPGACWPTPDFPETVVRVLGGVANPVGNLQLNRDQERLLVTYMKALTDGPALP